MRRDLRNSHHLATVSFDGRFWDAYLELVESPDPSMAARGRIAFSAADAGDVEPIRTTTLFIEETAQEVLTRAREFKTHQLVALLRSALPSESEEPEGPEELEEGETGSSPAPGPRGTSDQGDAADGP